MSSRPRTFVLLIGAARAVPYPISSNPTQDTPEATLQISAANGDAAGYFRLIALPPSPTTDLANMVTPVDPSSSSITRYELTEITPVPLPDPASSSTTRDELTEITPIPIPESTASSHTFVTITIAPPASTAEAQGSPNTITITDWVTVTLPGPPPNDSDSVTVPITVGPAHCSNVASRRPEMPGGILGGPAGTTYESDEAQPEE